MHELPSISMRILRGPDCVARQDELAKLRHAAQHIGFLCLTDCEDDVPQKLVEQTFVMSEALFALPRASLERIRLNRKTDKSNRGWEGMAEQALNAETQKGKEDLNFSYRCTDDFGTELYQKLAEEPSRPVWARFFAPNKWPDEAEIPGFRENSLHYLHANFEISKKLFGGIEEAFNMPNGYIVNKRTKLLDTFRRIYYPKLSTRVPVGQVGCGTHFDFGTGTIIRRKGRGCIKIKPRNSDWIEVHPPANAAIFNIGDMLQLWSNKKVQSTEHGVDLGHGDYSLVVFFYADYWEKLPNGATAGSYLSDCIDGSYRHMIAAEGQGVVS